MKSCAAVIFGFVVSALLASCSHMEAPSKNLSTIEYAIEPAIFEGTSALKVSLTFVTKAPTTSIQLPYKWASEKDYFKDIRELQAIGGVLKTTNEPQVRSVEASVGSRVTVSYVLLPGPSSGPNPFRALITPEYFHVIGHNLFATTEIGNGVNVEYKIEWRGFPESYRFANSYGANEKSQRFEGRLGQLQGNAIFLGGDIRIHKEMVRGRPVFIALRGKWKFSDDEFAQTLARLIETQRQFWNDDNFPYFLVTLIPNGKECCPMGGTGLRNSFATFVSSAQQLDFRFLWLYSHELFHKWIGQKIRNPDDNEQLYYWFSEGFTTYYGRLQQLRAGMLSLAEYIDDYNSDIVKYYLSPVRTVPNERILKDFWNDENVGKLPYYRGEILAHEWNLRLKRNGSSLDEPTRALLEGVPDREFNLETWRSVLSRYPSVGTDEDFQRYVDRGELQKPSREALGPCVRQRLRRVGPLVRGFNKEKTYETKRITGLDRNSPGYRAGLREGQELLERDLEDPQIKPARFKIRDAQGERWIEYMAIGKGAIDLPLYELDQAKFRKNPSACLNWFGALVPPS